MGVNTVTNPARIGFLSVVAVLILVFSTGLTSRLELHWLDRQLDFLAERNFAAGADGNVVVVGIDDASLRSFAVPVATMHRQIGQFFEAMALARPRAVGVDMVLPEASYDRIQPGLDAAMARGILALRAVSPLVIGVGANLDGTMKPLHPLFMNLAGQEGLGSVFVAKDADGVVRRFDELLTADGQVLPTLAGQLARRTGLTVSYGIMPMYQGQRFGYVPLHDVLAWHAANDRVRLEQVFRGRRVLLGSLLSHDDQHIVPIALAVGDSGNTTHGVFVHAMQLRSLEAGGLIKELPLALQIGAALVLALSWWLTPGWLGWLLVTIGTAGIFAASIAALTAGWSIPAVFWGMGLLGGLGGRTALAASQSAAQRRLLRRAFDGFVSPSVLKEMLDGRLNPQTAGVRKEVCVLFSDIRGFTTLSEHLPPEAVTDLLNRYFERMTSAIHRHGGTLDKFIGDGIMAIFGAPQGLSNACESAFGSAVDMLDELDEFNSEQQARGGPILAIGIGLHFGPVFIGYIGSKLRHEYSAIGDTVNSASRLEGLTKETGYPILLSMAVRQKLNDAGGFKDLGEHVVKGRAPMAIWGWERNRKGTT